MASRRADRGFVVEQQPAGRQAVLDLLAFARRVAVIHGLMEVDVTEVRQELAQHAGATVTAYVTASVARAIARHPEINVRRAGRRIVRFDHVDIVVTAEQHGNGEQLPRPHVLKAVEDMAFDDVAAHVRNIRSSARGTAGARDRAVLERLPSPLRRLGARLATRVPAAAARFGPPTAVSSLGMFGTGMAWGVPVSPLTLMVTVGSIGTRLALIDGQLCQREVLALTLSFDHGVVDGAPAARFASSLRDLLEKGTVLGLDAGTG